MGYVRIKKSGFVAYDWHGERRKYIGRRVRPARVLSRLREPCRIASDVTLGDIFHAVEKHPPLVDFLSQYSWCGALADFHADALDKLTPSDDDKFPLQYLEVYWHEHLTTYKGSTDFDIGPSFHGIGPAGENAIECGRDPNALIAWAIAFSPLSRLVHLPVRLNKSVCVWEPWRRGMKVADRKVLLKAERDYSFLDVLDAIYDEISFHGTPAQRDQRMSDINEQLKEIREHLDNGGDPADL